jgi:hypothetical protein
MSNERAALGDPKNKSEYQSRDKKHRREMKARGKPAQRYAGAFGSTNDKDKPSNECRDVVF